MGCKLMRDTIILTNVNKFLHPFITIIYQNVLWHSILADNLIFQKLNNNENIMFFDKSCFTPFRIMVDSYKHIFIAISCF
jgi:hypothetical protein